MADQAPERFTADDFRDLAKKQNETFAPSGPVPRFKQFPGKATMILTCMDPRVQPHEFWGPGIQRMGVVRNAGGRAPEFLKSAEALTAIVGNGEGSVHTVAVVHHTDCGLLNFNDRFIKDTIKRRTPGLTHEQLSALEKADFGEMHDIDETVREDVRLIKEDPYLPKDMEVVGFVYDSFTGKTYEVV